MLTPSLEQVKQLAKQYNTIPVIYDFSADNPHQFVSGNV